jgi:hypothetical protein
VTSHQPDPKPADLNRAMSMRGNFERVGVHVLRLRTPRGEPEHTECVGGMSTVEAIEAPMLCQRFKPSDSCQQKERRSRDDQSHFEASVHVLERQRVFTHLISAVRPRRGNSGGGKAATMGTTETQRNRGDQ